MPKANSDSISFPDANGDPVVVPREDFTSDMPIVFGEPVAEEPAEEPAETEGEEESSPGNSSSPSTPISASSTKSSSRKTSSR